MQSKSIVLTCFFATMLAGSGCQQVLPPPEPPPYHGVRLRVACPAELVEMLEVQSRPWRARQEASVEVIGLTPGQSPASVGADIRVLPPAQMPHWAAAGKLRRLPEALTRRGDAYDWGGLLPFYRQTLLLWDQVPLALPLAGETAVLVYRDDLFRSADLDRRFRAWQARTQAGRSPQPLRPPLTWDDLALCAEFFRDEHPAGQSGPSLPPLPADAAALDALFYRVAAGYVRRGIRQDEPTGPDHVAEVFSFQYDAQTGEPLIDRPGFVAALSLLARLQKCRPADRHPRPAEAFVSGQAVLGIVPAAALLALQQAPAVRDRLGIAAVPGAAHTFTPRGQQKPAALGVNRVPYLGGAGWLAVVPSDAAAPEAAFDLLVDLTGSQRGQTALEPRWGGGPTRVEQLLRDRWDAFDLDRPRTQALKEAVTTLLLQHGLRNPALVLRLPDQEPHRAALVAGLERTLLQRLDPTVALAETARAWRELDRQKGSGRARADYRLSVGLLKD